MNYIFYSVFLVLILAHVWLFVKEYTKTNKKHKLTMALHAVISQNDLQLYQDYINDLRNYVNDVSTDTNKITEQNLDLKKAYLQGYADASKEIFELILTSISKNKLPVIQDNYEPQINTEQRTTRVSYDEGYKKAFWDAQKFLRENKHN